MQLNVLNDLTKAKRRWTEKKRNYTGSVSYPEVAPLPSKLGNVELLSDSTSGLFAGESSESASEKAAPLLASAFQSKAVVQFRAQSPPSCLLPSLKQKSK